MQTKEKPDKEMLGKLVNNLGNSIDFLKYEYTNSLHKKIIEDYNYLKENKKYMSIISKIKFNMVIERKIQSVFQRRLIAEKKLENPYSRETFSASLKPKNFSESVVSYESKAKESQTIVISDLHGNSKKWQIVKQYMQQNPKANFIILGDAIDRGVDGINILCDIKELSDKGKAIYVPGNHDAFAYNALMSAGDKRLEEKFEDDIKAWNINGGENTIQQFLSLKQEKMHELIEWLGKQPIQYRFKERR